MATVKERTLHALATRIEDMESKLEAARREIARTLSASDRVMGEEDLYWNQVYIDFLTDVIDDTERRLTAAHKTFNRAREARVTGRLQ